MATAKIYTMKPRVFDSREALMDVIRHELHDFDSKELKIVASQSDVTVSTLYAIRSGRTMWPRHKTFFNLINALGLQVELRRV